MKKVYRITESELMGVFKKVLTEMPMGVPDNITETAGQILSAIISKLSTQFDLSSADKDGYKIVINGNFRVAGYEFNEILFDLEMSNYIDEHAEDPPQIMGASVGNKMSVKGKYTHDEPNGEIMLKIRFGVGRNWNLGMLIDIMNSTKPKMIGMLSHELLHQFEHHKHPVRPATAKATYDGIQNLRIERVTPLNNFLHLLYFTHETERYTRSSELYGTLKANNVTKDNFKEHFYDSEIIKTLTECRDYTFAGLMSDLRNYMDEIDKFLLALKDQGGEVDLEASDTSRIDTALRYFHIILRNMTIDQYVKLLGSGINPFAQLASQMFGGGNGGDDSMEKAHQYANEFANKLQKTKNYQDFFGDSIKRLNFVGETSIKKLSKLYAMLDNNKDSITNWDLHHKINKTAEKTRMKLHELIRDPDTNVTKKK